ncbi:V-type ATPase subunit [Candidatus Bathyarchaeota archaeon]|nr:MAG: V-type ATPase subunit [Candidatus Bathyarchaeota archaeon]
MLPSSVQHVLRDNYTIAKIRGEKGLLLDRQQLYSLAEFRSQGEILGVLSDGTYGRELSELKEGSSPIEVERAIPFLQEITHRFDAYDLAALIVFKAQGKTWEEFIATRQPLAILKESELHRLYSLDDIRAIIGIMGDRTLEARVRDFAMADISGERAAFVRDIITGWGEERFYNYVNDNLRGHDRASCLPIVGATIDLMNLAIVLRSKLIGISKVEDHLIRGSWKLDPKTMGQVTAAQDVGQALELISSHSYYARILGSARQKYEETKSLSFIEIALRKHSIIISRRIFAGFPYTLGIILAFLILKENEARNLSNPHYISELFDEIVVRVAQPEDSA